MPHRGAYRTRCIARNRVRKFCLQRITAPLIGCDNSQSSCAKPPKKQCLLLPTFRLRRRRERCHLNRVPIKLLWRNQRRKRQQLPSMDGKAARSEVPAAPDSRQRSSARNLRRSRQTRTLEFGHIFWLNGGSSRGAREIQHMTGSRRRNNCVRKRVWRTDKVTVPHRSGSAAAANLLPLWTSSSPIWLPLCGNASPS